MRCDGGACHPQKRECDHPTDAVYAGGLERTPRHTAGRDSRKRPKGGSKQGRTYISDALRRIGRYIGEHALLGELQYSVAAKLLEELGTGEKLPPDEQESRIVIVLEDKEGWGE